MFTAHDWKAKVIAEFRANNGQVQAPYDDPPPMLLLHTLGARSGKEHVVPGYAPRSNDERVSGSLRLAPGNGTSLADFGT